MSDSAAEIREQLCLVLQGDENLWVKLPRSGRLLLGSDAARAGFHIEGQGIEDAHCAIGRVRAGGWAIRDLGSRYGTLVNGSRVETARLAEGDIIVLGSRRVTVTAQAPGATGEGSSASQASASSADSVVPAADATAPSEGGEDEQFLPGFHIDRRLGRGGMGEVHLALQQSLGRHVAVKVLSRRFTEDREFVLRFHSEARAAAALSHPNVVVVHDVGEADGRHFLVMEYMPGGSLEDRLAKQGRIPWREVLGVLHDAASGLTYAEAQGIVHRDIKPDNLMIAASGAVKIADLGLATPVSSEDGAAGPATTDVESKNYGTPHFLSPEQARGRPLDHRSDLYSLGATAYRLLTGKTPFHGTTTREIIRARFTQTPTPPREYVPEIPAALEELVLRLMALDPSDRPASAQELLHEVGRMRLEAEHGPAPEKKKASGSFLRVLVAFAIPLGIMGLWQLIAPEGKDKQGTEEDIPLGPTLSPFAGVEQNNDEAFFGDGTEAVLDPDEERELRAMELEAELALRQIDPSQDRIAALEDLIERFGPTRVAAEARKEIAAIRDAQIEERLARAREQLQANESLERLRTAAGWPPRESALPRVGEFLRRIDRYQVSLAVASSPLFIEGRAALIGEVMSRSLEQLRAGFERADDLMAKGAFEELSGLYEQLATCLDLPAMNETDESAGGREFEALGGLLELARIVAERRSKFGEDANDYAHRIAQEDRKLLGGTFGPNSGFASELDRLRLDLAQARLRACLAKLQTPQARDRISGIAARMREAEAALTLLGSTLSAGEWRRDTASVPSGKRSKNMAVAGVQTEGLLVTDDSGQELVPWAEFTQSQGSLHQLFKRRLERDYTPGENSSILSLLTLAAVRRALIPAEAYLDPNQRGLITPDQATEARAAFEPVHAWLTESQGAIEEASAVGSRAEKQAAELLITALTAAQDGAWTLASTSAERLLASYAETLVVLQVSEGSDAAPQVDEAQAGNPAESQSGG